MRIIDELNLSIQLENDKYYYAIDTIYLNTIKEDYKRICSQNIDSDLRNNVFKHTDFPFAKFYFNKNIFNLNYINCVNYNEVSLTDNSVFSTDTGLIIIFQEHLFEYFIREFAFKKLHN